MVYRNPQLSLVTPIFAGYDAEHYDLPEALLAARAGLARLEEALTALGRDLSKANPSTAKAVAIRAVVDAALVSDLPAKPEAEFVATQEKYRLLSAREDILTEARDQAGSRIPYEVIALSDVILEEYLRPAFDALLDSVRDGAKIAPSVPWDRPRQTAGASQEVRDFYQLASAGAEQYIALRTAQRALAQLVGDPSAEALRAFGELRNMYAIFPRLGSQMPGVSAPWPSDPLQRLVWLATSAAEPWLPTSAECDTAWAEHIAGVRSKGNRVPAG